VWRKDTAICLGASSIICFCESSAHPAHQSGPHRAICERDCEGIIAKQKLGTYTTAGPATWFKVLNAAYTQKEDRRELFEGFKERTAQSSEPASFNNRPSHGRTWHLAKRRWRGMKKVLSEGNLSCVRVCSAPITTTLGIIVVRRGTEPVGLAR
jgi:hypothetical protein